MALMTEEGVKMATVSKQGTIGEIKLSPSMIDTPTISKEIVEEIIKMMPKEKIEETQPKEVLCKMMIKGKASKLQSIIDQVINAYYRSSSSYQTGFDKELIVTLMIENGEEKKVK